MLAVAPDTVRSQLHHGIRVAKGTEGSDCSPFLACFLWKEQILRTVCVKCLKKSFEFELIVMAGEGINEDYPVEIHEYLSTFENSIGAVDEMLKTMMSVSRNELLQKLDPLEQAKVDLVSAYTLNSMFWVYLATQGVNPKEHPVKQELVQQQENRGVSQKRTRTTTKKAQSDLNIKCLPCAGRIRGHRSLYRPSGSLGLSLSF
uniref:Nuclear nucleic acid-binding protein C1D n=1 Tax=Capra hircus TaxID=9925 RepID=A0A8C2NNM7_CAPHI